MSPIPFRESNKTYHKPQGWTDEQCSDLHVWEGPVPIDANTAVNGIISCWMPTEEELADLNAGKPIFISVLSNVQPPISLFTANPFIQTENLSENA